MPDLITSDLGRIFQSMRSGDPLRVERQRVAGTVDYRRIPRQQFAPVTSVDTGNWGNGEAGMRRFASSGGIVYGQPQFFSPVHTPINWQIPSKRLEMYQWCLTPCISITCEDFIQKLVSEVSLGEKVLTHDGTFKEIEKIGIRKVNEDIYHLTVQSEYEKLEITGNHKVYCVKSEDASCKYKLENKTPQRCTPLFGTKCATYKKQDKPPCQKTELKISHILASELKENDFMLFPVPKQEKSNEEFNENRARLLGYYAAEGCGYRNKKYNYCIVDFTLNIDEKETLAKEIIELLEKEFPGTEKPNIYVWAKRPNTLKIKFSSEPALAFFKKHCPGNAIDKQLSKDVLALSPQLQKHFIACYISGDGHFKVRNGVLLEVSMSSASKILLEQVKIMLGRNDIPAGAVYSRECKLKYKGIIKTFIGYILSFSESSLKKMGNIFCGKDFKFKETNSKNHSQIVDGYILKRIRKIEKVHYEGDVYNLEVKDNHSYVANGCLVHNCRFFYENEPKVAAAIDFYAQFPMSNWEHECKNRKISEYFDKFKKRLHLPKWCRLISHELHLLGDCFPFTEVSCSLCGGTGKIGSDICEHEEGTLRRVVILNPDNVEVYTGALSQEPVIAMRPDEELINIVQRKTPGYEKFTGEVRKLISSGQPIRLSNSSITHLKYCENGYQKFGIGMVRRLFPILSYKTKLMVAQWIVAERLIVPIKVVKVGSDERPAGPADIAAVQAMLANTANDPNMTIVTHHAFEMDFIGASGKVLTLSNELEFINQEILDGMMINNALLNGEGPNFTQSIDTRLLTNNGLKYCDEFDIEKDMVATLNLHTGKLEYQKAIQKYEYNWNSIDGDDPPLKRFLTNRIDMLVTPNHKMLLKERKLTTGPRGQKLDGQTEGYGEWKVVRAAHVKNRSRFRACVEGWDGTTEDRSKYFGIETDDFLRIVGWYVSEGYRNHSILKDGTERINLVSFSQSPTANAKTYEKMKQLLVKNNLFKVNPSSNNVFILTKKSNEGLVNYLADNIGEKANSKHIPQALKNMSSDKLKVLLEALVDGDGSERPATVKKETDKKYYSYTTVSTRLRDDVIEILFKLGFSPRFIVVKFDSPNLQTQYTISWSGDSQTGKFPVLESRKWNGEGETQTSKQVIFDEDYVGKVWCVEVPNHFIVTERNGLFGIHGNSSASVGIEAMIQRLTTFREQITEWLENAIYIPEAKRQGFFEEDEDTGEQVPLIPKIKWNSMHLRDQQQYRTFLMQLYEKGVLSAQSLLEAFDIDPDQEIERKRYDALQMVALGQGQQGGAGGGGGGGMGGLPPPGGGGAGGEPPISAPGGEMGGAPGEGPAAPVGGAPVISKSSSIVAEVASPDQFGGRVLRKNTREKILSDQRKQQQLAEQEKQRQQRANSPDGKGQERDEKGRICRTKCERDLIPHIIQAKRDGLLGNYAIEDQFRIIVNDRENVIDFAFPQLKLGIEADGEIYHSAPKQVKHDKERDAELGRMGWTILRFLETQIEKSPQACVQQIIKAVMQKQLALKNLAAEHPAAQSSEQPAVQ